MLEEFCKEVLGKFLKESYNENTEKLLKVSLEHDCPCPAHIRPAISFCAVREVFEDSFQT